MKINRRWYKNDGPWTVAVSIMLTDGRPKNLTAASEIFWWFYTDLNTPILTKTLGAGVEIGDATEGVAIVTVDKADLAPLSPGVYASRMRVVDSDGIARTVNEDYTLLVDSPPEA